MGFGVICLDFRCSVPPLTAVLVCVFILVREVYRLRMGKKEFSPTVETAAACRILTWRLKGTWYKKKGKRRLPLSPTQAVADISQPQHMDGGLQHLLTAAFCKKRVVLWISPPLLVPVTPPPWFPLLPLISRVQRLFSLWLEIVVYNGENCTI